jgi:uncharacterized protein
MIYIRRSPADGGGFEWDADNVAHIARHGVQPADAEQALSNDPITLHYAVTDSGEERWVCVGPTDARRLLVIVWTMRASLVRVVTAYPASGRLRGVYAKAKQLGEAGEENDSAVQD